MFRPIPPLVLVLLVLHGEFTVSSVAHGGSSSGSSGPVTVSLRGGSRRSVEARELYGVVELALPLDSLPSAALRGRSRLLAENAESAPRESDELEASDGSSTGAEPGELRRPPRGGGEHAREERARDAGQTLPVALPRSALLDRHLIRECVARALRDLARWGVAARLDGYGSRARWAAALPELRLRGGRSADSSLRLAPTIDDPYRYTQSDAADLFFEVDLRWRLDRLLYDSDELAVERLRAQHSSTQAKRLHDVLGRLADWQDGAVRFADPTLAPKVRIEAWVRMSIAGFWLDAFTGGWFGEAVKHRLDALTARLEG